MRTRNCSIRTIPVGNARFNVDDPLSNGKPWIMRVPFGGGAQLSPANCLAVADLHASCQTSLAHHYLSCFYWAVTTLTKVGSNLYIYIAAHLKLPDRAFMCSLIRPSGLLPPRVLSHCCRLNTTWHMRGPGRFRGLHPQQSPRRYSQRPWCGLEQ